MSEEICKNCKYWETQFMDSDGYCPCDHWDTCLTPPYETCNGFTSKKDSSDE